MQRVTKLKAAVDGKTGKKVRSNTKDKKMSPKKMENGEKKKKKEEKRKFLKFLKFLCSGWKLDGGSVNSGCLLQKMKKNKLCRAFKLHQRRRKRRRVCAEAGSVYSTRCCRMLLPGEVAKMQLLGRLLPRNLVGKTKKNEKDDHA